MKIEKTKVYGIPMYECYIDVYSQYFYLFFGKKNFSKLDKIVNTDLGQESSDPGNACVIQLQKPHPYSIMIWFPNRDYENVKNGNLAHECLHLIDYISENKGLKHDINNQEVYAQFMGYLFRNLLPFFKKY